MPSDVDVLQQFIADPKNANDPRLAKAKAKLAQMQGGTGGGGSAPSPDTRAASKPFGSVGMTNGQPGLLRRFLDTTADQAPDLGTMVGGAAGAVAGGGTPASLALVPAGGAAGRGLGEFYRDLYSRYVGLPAGSRPTATPGETAVSGAGDAMMQNATGNLMGGVANEFVKADPLLRELGGKATPFANLSPEAFDAVRAKGMQPSPTVMSAPRGDLAEKGAKFASPESVEAAQRGAQSLRRIAAPLQETADIGSAGEQGRMLATNTEDALRSGDQGLQQAKAAALEKIRETAPPYRTVEPGEREMRPGGDTALPTPTIKPAGEGIINKAFNEPDAQNFMLENKAAPAREALADVKSRGLEQGALGDLKRGAFTDAMKAEGLGIGPKEAAASGSDADELEALARTVMRQRGGIQQQGPSGLFPRTLYETQKLFAGPRSTMGGIRPETPEAALQANTPRLLEIEAMRRGMPPVSPAVRDAATEGLDRPLFRALANPNARATMGPAAYQALAAELARIRASQGGGQ